MKRKGENLQKSGKIVFFLFTLSQILGILMKYLCINCVFWQGGKYALPGTLSVMMETLEREELRE